MSLWLISFPHDLGPQKNYRQPKVIVPERTKFIMKELRTIRDPKKSCPTNRLGPKASFFEKITLKTKMPPSQSPKRVGFNSNKVKC